MEDPMPPPDMAPPPIIPLKEVDMFRKGWPGVMTPKVEVIVVMRSFMEPRAFDDLMEDMLLKIAPIIVALSVSKLTWQASQLSCASEKEPWRSPRLSNVL